MLQVCQASIKNQQGMQKHSMYVESINGVREPHKFKFISLLDSFIMIIYEANAEKSRPRRQNLVMAVVVVVLEALRKQLNAEHVLMVKFFYRYGVFFS